MWLHDKLMSDKSEKYCNCSTHRENNVHFSLLLQLIDRYCGCENNWGCKMIFVSFKETPNANVNLVYNWKHSVESTALISYWYRHRYHFLCHRARYDRYVYITHLACTLQHGILCACLKKDNAILSCLFAGLPHAAFLSALLPWIDKLAKAGN